MSHTRPYDVYHAVSVIVKGNRAQGERAMRGAGAVHAEHTCSSVAGEHSGHGMVVIVPFPIRFAQDFAGSEKVHVDRIMWTGKLNEYFEDPSSPGYDPVYAAERAEAICTDWIDRVLNDNPS